MLHKGPLKKRVGINKTDDAFFRVLTKSAAQHFELFKMAGEGKFIVYKNGIVPPDYLFFAQAFRQGDKSLNDLRFVQVPLYGRIVGGKGKLKVLPVAQRVNFREAAQKIPGILGPENDAVCQVRLKG
jgi:hypothetical protein